MKRPVVFIAVGMALAFALLAGVAIIASNVMAGTRLREFSNGDIDVTIALSRPTAVLPIGGSGSRAGDALHQRDLDYEAKLREMARMAQATQTVISVSDPTEAPSATPMLLPTATRRIRNTATPASTDTPVPAPTEQRREDRREPEPTHTAQPQPTAQPQAPAPTADDNGGERNTPQPPAQPQPPAPTDDHGGGNDGGNDNRGPSPSNTPKPEESHGGSDNGGRDKPPDPTKEP